MDPGVFSPPLPVASRRQLRRRFCFRRSSREIKRATRARAHDNGFLCVYLYRRRFARVTSDRERISRSLAYNAKQQKNPLSSSVRFRGNFSCRFGILQRDTEVRTVVVSFFFVFSSLFFSLSPFPSSFSLPFSLLLMQWKLRISNGSV